MQKHVSFSLTLAMNLPTKRLLILLHRQQKANSKQPQTNMWTRGLLRRPRCKPLQTKKGLHSQKLWQLHIWDKKTKNPRLLQLQPSLTPQRPPLRKPNNSLKIKGLHLQTNRLPILLRLRPKKNRKPPLQSLLTHDRLLQTKPRRCLMRQGTLLLMPRLQILQAKAKQTLQLLQKQVQENTQTHGKLPRKKHVSFLPILGMTQPMSKSNSLLRRLKRLHNLG